MVPKYSYSARLLFPSLSTAMPHPSLHHTCGSFPEPGHCLAFYASQWLKDSTLRCNSKKHPVVQGSYAWNGSVSKSGHLFIIRKTAAGEPLTVCTSWIGGQMQGNPYQAMYLLHQPQKAYIAKRVHMTLRTHISHHSKTPHVIFWAIYSNRSRTNSQSN